MNLTSIPAFQDNYIWMLSDNNGKCLIVDPGDAIPVLDAIKAHGWQPEIILLTHHHRDHVGGVGTLIEHFPSIHVYGPEETRAKGANIIVDEGDTFSFAGHEFQVIATPGHTLGHICYFSFPYLFSGDTLFSAGCGSLFEGTAAQMYSSFGKINALPEETLICCGHEYTLSNITFSHHILPDDEEITQCYRQVKALRDKNQITLPSTLKKERIINLFLKTQCADFIKKINKETNLQQPEHIFAWLREKKDSF